MKQALATDARTSLLDAAETLFGSVGLQASVRDITAAAGVNLAAVNYHFQSKEKLIGAVLERRAAPVNAERLQMLDEYEAEAAGNPVAVEKILTAFLIPTREIMDEHPQFLRFAGRVITDPGEGMREVLAAQFGEVAQRFHSALCRALHPLPPEEVWLRLGFMLGSVIYVWTNGAALIGRLAGAEATGITSSAILERLIQYGAAGMRSGAGLEGGLL
jgi:AcrR family transcriptional regulator